LSFQYIGFCGIENENTSCKTCPERRKTPRHSLRAELKNFVASARKFFTLTRVSGLTDIPRR
jgi:hypothetical protein